MQRVKGYLQTYDWGPIDGLRAWTTPTGGPQAELWFGTHPNGPSPRIDDGQAARGTMPILTKILAAAKPLSIQIHPPAELAAAMYADPQLRPLVSDANGKAELLIAFEPFIVLEGFRDPTRSAEIFAHLGEEMAPVAQALRNADLRSAITELLSMDAADVEPNAQRLPSALAEAGLSEHTVDTIREVLAAFPGDPGVFVACLLNARTLQRGQAIFVDPGTVHAYVRGLGLEVMTNSDNVLRLGLTSKTIAVEAAFQALDFTAQPHACNPETIEGIRTYAPESAPFTVQVVEHATTTASAGHARTVVCLDGTVRVNGSELTCGEGALLGADEPDCVIEVQGVAIVAHQAIDGMDS